jgi:hypothetical protein
MGSLRRSGEKASGSMFGGGISHSDRARAFRRRTLQSAPWVSFALGWLILALQVGPWMRSRMETAMLGGALPSPRAISPVPSGIMIQTLIAVALLLAAIVLLITRARKEGGVGAIGDRLLAREIGLVGVVGLLGAVLASSILARGTPTFMDTRTHVARGSLWYEFLRRGIYPLWTDLWAGGFPADQHYPPLAHILQALLMFTGLDAYGAVKLLMWLSRISGGIGFALLCSHVHKDHRSGLVGGLIYALSPPFHALWIWYGWVSGAVMLGVMPWAFLAAELLASGNGGTRAGAGLGLSIGAMVLAHTLPSRLALILLAAFVLVRAAPAAVRPRAFRPSVRGLLLGGLGGAGLAACFLLPIIRESRFVNDIMAPEFALGFHIPQLQGMIATLRWTSTGKEYLGITVALLALIGLIVSARDRGAKRGAIGTLPLLFLVALPWFFFRPGPHVIVPIFLGIMLAAAGAVRRSSARPPIQQGLLYPLALLFLLIDLAPLSLLTTYGEHVSWRHDLYTRLQERIGGGRFLELPVDGSGRVVSSLWGYSDIVAVPSIGCPFYQGAPKAYGYAAALIDTLAHAMRAGHPVDGRILTLLALEDVRYVVIRQPRGPLIPPGAAGEGFSVDPSIPGLLIDGASIVSVLEPHAPSGPDLPAAAVIGEDGLPPGVSRSIASAEIAWVDAARARLVLLDGKEGPFDKAPLGGISIDVPAGPHQIEILGTETPLRRACRLAQWSLAVGLFLLSLPRRAWRRS